MKSPKELIAMNDLKRDYQNFKDELDPSIRKVLSSGRYIGGAEVDRFEKKWAQYLGEGWVVSCGNGTDALQIALMALDLTPGDEVIMPAYGYISAAEVAVLLGLRPVLVDVDETGNMDVSLIEEAISPKSRVILPMHLYGRCADMDEIMQIARKHNLMVIEDAAQAAGSTCEIGEERVKAGTIGDIGTFSHFPTKNLNCYGDGGSIYTTHRQLAEKMFSIKRHGQDHEKYIHNRLGINSRLDALQAAILQVKLRHLDFLNDKRRKVADRYYQLLEGHYDIALPIRSEGHVFHQFALRLPKEVRQRVKDYLASSNVQTIIYYPKSISQQAVMKGKVTVHSTQKAIQLSDTILCLPMHPFLTHQEIDYICTRLIEGLQL